MIPRAAILVTVVLICGCEQPAEDLDQTTPLETCRAFVRHFKPGADASAACLCSAPDVTDDCTARIGNTWLALDCGDGWCDIEKIGGGR